MTEHNLPVPDDAPWLNLSPQEVEELRNSKKELTEYGREKIRELMLKYDNTCRMTERKFIYDHYIDMENGDDVESIDYRSLIHILTELMNRIEKLETFVKNQK